MIETILRGSPSQRLDCRRTQISPRPFLDERSREGARLTALRPCRHQGCRTAPGDLLPIASARIHRVLAPGRIWRILPFGHVRGRACPGNRQGRPLTCYTHAAHVSNDASRPKVPVGCDYQRHANVPLCISKWCYKQFPKKKKTISEKEKNEKTKQQLICCAPVGAIARAERMRSVGNINRTA